MVEKILAALFRKDASVQAARFEAGAHPVGDLIQQLNTRPLFGSFALLFFDGVERLKKEEAEGLLYYLINPSHSSFLVLGASSSKILGEMYQKAKKEMVVLDLSDEKPWERQRRLAEELAEEAKKAGKTVSSEAAAYLFEHVGLDMPGLCQELAKLVCFVGERPLIQKADAEKICVSRVELTSWQLSEKVIWGKESIGAEKKEDLSFILPFIGGLRYQLQIGLQLAELAQKGASGQEIARLLPQLRPQTLDKYLPIVRQKKAAYFRKGLHALFELEFSAKSASIDLGTLFDRFLAKLRYEDTIPTTQLTARRG